MPKTIEEEFKPEQVSYVERVWTFLAENGRQGAWLLSLELMEPVYDLVERDARNLGKYRTVSDRDSLYAR